MIILLVSIFKHLLPRHVSAIALWPFILFRHKEHKSNLRIINHEKIHLKQQLELLILPFYLIYITEYLVRLIQTKNHDKAYRAICFEQEAYTHDNDFNYLKTSRLYAMWRKNKTQQV